MYTLSSVASVPEQAILNGQKAPFTLDQFVPVARVTVDVVSLVVRADSPYKTYQDFVAALKANPKGMTYSSSGNYGISHFPAEMLLAATQTEARHIPYAGGAPMLTALMGGQVDFNIPVRTLALPHVQSGRLRYLAMYGARRWAQAPDVPTLAELGVPIDFVPWTGLFAPAGTPAEILATLRRALRAASQDSQFAETVGKSSAGEIAYLDGSELETFWKADLARTSVTIQRIGRIQ
jgi:tripartite-type tricarboxylate transporter receptor subunit TctC